MIRRKIIMLSIIKAEIVYDYYNYESYALVLR